MDEITSSDSDKESENKFNGRRKTVDHSFSKAGPICCNAVDPKNNASTISDDDPTSGSDFEVKGEERSFNQINCSPKERECIMESKLACTLILALAILIGFSFVGYGEAKAAQLNPADFRSFTFSAVACCHPDFNNTAFNGFQFSQKNQSGTSFRVFAFTDPEFQGDVTRTFSKNFVPGLDVAAESFQAFEFKAELATSFANSRDFSTFVRKASFNDRTFQRGDTFESNAFTPSARKENDFQVSFEVAAFDNGFASFGCCKPVGFTGNNFQGFDGQFQV